MGRAAAESGHVYPDARPLRGLFLKNKPPCAIPMLAWLLGFRPGALAALACGLLALGVVPAGSRLFAPPAAWCQNFGERTVSGAVLDASSHPINGATVFLKNEKTKAIRSYISTADGHFHFSQIDMSIDYDLWAEKDGKKSATKTVSSWDARKQFISDLKLK